ncbi:MAG: hypothetical protein H6585_05435 [Flavobacteriales bacterium]|nr:hypothetical protein [Flavobacteriales bacterium]MCB9447772.1 hypothetical protein [Flavobacteriales bacterium]
MARDFTLISYEHLLVALQQKGYRFVTFEEFLTTSPEGKIVIMRHDVDDKPLNSQHTAEIEHKLGIRGVYYFRIVRQSNDPAVIRAIAEMGHEIGYHYEDLALARGDFKKAMENFEKNLKYFREFYPVRTICMHGSPTSKWDNRKVWEKYKYKDFDIIGEPYLDLNFNSFCYLTDTGRKWNGDQVSIRDKVHSPHQFNFRKTKDIIKNIDALPEQVMITVHPQRWNDPMVPWVTELVYQNAKNLVKWLIIR